ncbi:MAG: GAF domain-containing protein [Bacteroidales bacterium]|nr:GAF domain-containing protein [Bacteroidales bacterium]
MKKTQKQNRYQRIYKQLSELLPETNDTLARMSSVIAVLHNKMDHFFWTGYYFLKDGRLIVGPYQGSVACQELEKGKGVCWTGIERQESVIVPDVEQFPGHIACDSRSKSEIVVPVRNNKDTIIGVLDIDSKEHNAFDSTDEQELSRIIRLIYEL